MAPLPAAAGECFAVWRGAVPRFNLWDQSFSRVELDQRSREAWLRIERQVRLLYRVLQRLIPCSGGSFVF